MRTRGFRFEVTIILLLWVGQAYGQEATSGLELGATLSGLAAYSRELSENPRNGAPEMGGVRLMLTPLWKLNRYWSVSGTIQVRTRPYFHEEFGTQGYGVRTDVLQLTLNYARVWGNRSFLFRAGEVSSAFGSFGLRYADDKNPLIDVPLTYGYYGKGVTLNGLTGAQVEATLGKLDVRAQLTNSSPANRRSIFDRDQYGNWAGGIGYTILQGFRIGASGYRGPYLNRTSPFFRAGEAKPSELPGTGIGVDVSWGRGPWSANGELERFILGYRVRPTISEDAAYGELRRVLHPRWYVAGRVGWMRTSTNRRLQVYETAVGYRPNRFQLLKVGYEIQRGSGIRGTLDNVLAVQLVTSFTPLSYARH